MNAFVREALANGVRGVAERHAVSPDAVGVGRKPGPEGGAGGRTDGLAVVGALKTHTLRRNAVQVRGPQAGFRIAIQHVVADGFTKNHDRLAGLRLVTPRLMAGTGCSATAPTLAAPASFMKSLRFMG